MNETGVTTNNAMKTLKREWVLVGLAGAGIYTAGLAVFLRYWASAGWLFGVIAGAFMLYQWLHLARNLKANYDTQNLETLYPNLGAANWITLIRAYLLALLAGFFLLPRPSMELAWAPAVLYTTAAVLDFFDGSVARLTHRATRLGEILDMHWDGFGVLAASILLVVYGQVPVWYLLVGLARYVFVFGIWLRRRSGKVVLDLPPNVFRRALAGVQMGFIAAVLMPVFSPPITWVAASLFALPLLIGFLRDWLFVCGALDARRGQGRLQRLFREWGPLLLRFTLVALLGLVLIDQARSGVHLPGLVIAGVPALAALALGAAGRFSGLVILLMSGFALQIFPLDWRFWLMLLLGTGVMTFGTGRFSLWKPEDWLIHHRIGDPRNPR